VSPARVDLKVRGERAISLVMRARGVLAVLLLSGCPAPNPTPDSGVLELCASQSSEVINGTTVAVCTEAFSTAPLVRPPEDSEGKVYGGIARDTSLALAFIGRGVSFPLSPGGVVDAELSSNRYGYFLYVADVRGGAVGKLTPVARIDDRVFARLLAGKVLEGTASARASDGGTATYDYLSTTVPMRIRLDAAPGAMESDHDTQFPRFALGGHIENFDGGVRASDGGCFAALTTFGTANPMFSATSDAVEVKRHPNMHGGADDVFTLAWPDGVSAGSNMGPGLFISVGALIQSSAPVVDDARSSPHGVPWGAPSAELRVVSGGGASCP
jgi:hypothetical protein